MNKCLQPEMMIKSDLCRRSYKICDRVDDDSGQGCSWNPEERRGKAIQSNNDDDGGVYTSQRRTDTRLGLERGTRERPSRWISAKARSNRICNTDRNQFLVWIDFVTIYPPESCGDK